MSSPGKFLTVLYRALCFLPGGSSETHPMSRVSYFEFVFTAVYSIVNCQCSLKVSKSKTLRRIHIRQSVKTRRASQTLCTLQTSDVFATTYRQAFMTPDG